MTGETMNRQLQMVDLTSQYLRIKTEIDQAIQDVLDSARFIKGPVVQAFEKELSEFLDVRHVISCANGTDALQVAVMALDIKPGDEIIVPAFTYAATAEVIGLLRLTPIMVDVDLDTFNTSAELIEPYISNRTKAIVPVHLYGQCCDMDGIMELASKYNLHVIEDSAQSIGSMVQYQGDWQSSGSIGHIGCTSFFPSKNLGCYGDGGAIYTNDDTLAEKIRMIANHGQRKKYYHSVIGVNSRLDAIQAAILRVKLKYLRKYCNARIKVADKYDAAFRTHSHLAIPERSKWSTHVFHQYTLQIGKGLRDELKSYLSSRGIATMIYYPLPLYRQEAYAGYFDNSPLPNSEQLCASVLSLPIHTEMISEDQNYIIDSVLSFFQDF